MIVLDASAALDLLLGSGRAEHVRARVTGETIHAPHLIDVEIAHVLRRHTQAGAVDHTRAEAALSVWQQIQLDRHAHEPLLDRIWALRQTMTAYEAAYVALAEAIACPLLTCDAKLARSHGHSARIEIP